MNKFNCILDIEQNNLTVTQYVSVTLLLHMGQLGYNNYVTIPARCEIVYFVRITLQNECVVSPKQLSEF